MKRKKLPFSKLVPRTGRSDEVGDEATLELLSLFGDAARHFDSRLWAVPSVALSISVGGIAFVYSKPEVISDISVHDLNVLRLIVAFMNLLFWWVAMIWNIRDRIYQLHLERVLGEFQKRLLYVKYPIFTTHRDSDGVLLEADDFWVLKAFRHASATKTTIFMMFTVLVINIWIFQHFFRIWITGP
jgi:hypothetical protein